MLATKGVPETAAVDLVHGDFSDSLPVLSETCLISYAA
jgi:hypothetical protein